MSVCLATGNRSQQRNEPSLWHDHARTFVVFFTAQRCFGEALGGWQPVRLFNPRFRRVPAFPERLGVSGESTQERPSKVLHRYSVPTHQFLTGRTSTCPVPMRASGPGGGEGGTSVRASAEGKHDSVVPCTKARYALSSGLSGYAPAPNLNVRAGESEANSGCRSSGLPT